MELDAEVFSLRGSPADLPCHGGAVLGARADIGQRGISLDAAAQIQVQTDADSLIGKGVRAAVAAGADIGVGAAIEAVFPMDFFHQAGFVARLEIKAEVAGFVRADLQLRAAQLVERIRNRVPASLGPLVDVFVEEVVVQAGLWGRAGLAIEIFGQLTVTGSLLSVGELGPGYTFTLRYGAGIGFCSGLQTQINVGFADPGRLLQRLAAVSAGLLERRLMGDGPQVPAAVAAIGFIRLLLPLATRTLFEVGFRIASGADAAATTRALAHAFVVEARTLFVRAIVDAASRRLVAQLNQGELRTALLQLGANSQQTVLAELQRMRDRLRTIGDARGDDLLMWVPAVMEMCSGLSRLISRGHLAGDAAAKLVEVLALLWAAGALAEQLGRWSTQVRDGAIADLDTAITARPSPTIATAIGVEPGEPITTAQLVDFLIGADPLAEIRQLCPELAQAIDLVETVAESLGGPSTIAKLFRPGQFDDAACAAILAALGERLGPAIEATFAALGPRFSDDEDATILSGVARPILAAIPAIVFPNIGNIGNVDARRRLLEGISAVLFQTVQHLVMGTVDGALESVLTEGEQALRNVAENLRNNQVSAVAAVCERGLLGMTITRADIADLLRISADVVQLLNTHERGPLLDATRSLLALGLTTEATRAESFQRLINTDDVPQEADLQAALALVGSGAWRVFKDVFPKTLLLFANHWLGMLVDIARAIAAAASTALEAVRQGIAALVSEIEELGQRLLEYAAKAAELVGTMAGRLEELAQYLLGREDAVLDAIRDHARSALDDFISWAPGLAQDAVRALFNGLFDAVEHLLKAPLRVLGAVSGFVHDAITEALADGAMSKSAILDEVADEIHDWAATALTFPLPKINLGLTSVDFGTLRIPAEEVLDVIANAVCNNNTVGAAVDDCIATATELRATQTNHALTERALAQERTQQALSDELLEHTTQPPALRIIAPANEAVFDVQTTIVLRVDHANPTFVESPLGVPRRIRIFLNGEEYPYEATDWRRQGDGLTFRAVVTRKKRLLVPHILQRQPRELGEMAAAPLAPGVTTPPVAIELANTPTLGRERSRKRSATGGSKRPSGAATRQARARTVARAVLNRDPQRVAAVRPVGERLPSNLDVALGYMWQLPGADEDLPVIVGEPGANLISLLVADGANDPPKPLMAVFFLD